MTGLQQARLLVRNAIRIQGQIRDVEEAIPAAYILKEHGLAAAANRVYAEPTLGRLYDRRDRITNQLVELPLFIYRAAMKAEGL